MDIISSLETPTDENWHNYIITEIEETFKNFIEVDRIYFNEVDKAISFKSLVGLSDGDVEELIDIQSYLNKSLKKSFRNLLLNIKSYRFKKDPDNNVLSLNIDLTCDLLGAPKALNFTLSLKEGA